MRGRVAELNVSGWNLVLRRVSRHTGGNQMWRPSSSQFQKYPDTLAPRHIQIRAKASKY